MASIVKVGGYFSYPFAWAEVSYLIHLDPARFHLWRRAINNGVPLADASLKHFGPITPKFEHSFETWLESNLPPWRVVSGEWLPWGKAFEGRADALLSSVAVLKKLPSQLTINLDAMGDDGVAGVVFGFVDRRAFHVLEHRAGAAWEHVHYQGARIDRVTLDAPVTADSVTIKTGAGVNYAEIQGHTYTLTNTPGDVGVWVKAGKARFRCEWK
jgi:hypothetical protein